MFKSYSFIHENICTFDPTESANETYKRLQGLFVGKLRLSQFYRKSKNAGEILKHESIQEFCTVSLKHFMLFHIPLFFLVKLIKPIFRANSYSCLRLALLNPHGQIYASVLCCKRQMIIYLMQRRVNVMSMNINVQIKISGD